jgi:hypothetical protein
VRARAAWAQAAWFAANAERLRRLRLGPEEEEEPEPGEPEPGQAADPGEPLSAPGGS